MVRVRFPVLDPRGFFYIACLKDPPLNIKLLEVGTDRADLRTGAVRRNGLLETIDSVNVAHSKLLSGLLPVFPAGNVP